MVQKEAVKKILIIVGATATGKTDAAILAAKELDAEIISADSMQVYKKMDIGTAKPTIFQQSQIKHHMIDIIQPSENFSADIYVRETEKIIAEISNKNKIVIIVGGTGFYVNSLLYPLEFDVNPQIRNQLSEYLKNNGLEALYNKLKEIDPISAKQIHPNNTRKVLRALEIFYSTGIAKSQGERATTKPKYDYCIVQMVKDRKTLYDDINMRVDKMIENGLLEEVKELEGQLGSTASQAIGYKELIDYLNHKLSFDEAVNLIKQRSRNYAKRQLTYFAKMHTTSIDATQNEQKKNSRILDVYNS